MKIAIALLVGLLLSQIPLGAAGGQSSLQLWGGASLWSWAGCGLSTGVLLGLLVAPEPSSKAVALALVGEVISCWQVVFG